MSRRPHKLKTIKGSERKDNWLFFDCESKPEHKGINFERHKLYLGYAVHYRLDRSKTPQKDILFYTPEDFYNFVESCTRPKSTLYISALNVAYDFTISSIPYQLKANGWNLINLMIEGKVTILKYKKDDKSITFIDVFNYMKASVKMLGELVGLPKLDVDFKDVSDEELKIYCKRDVEIIAKAMIKYMDFIQKHDLGCFGVTCSSQAFNAFRHRFMNHEIFIHNIDGASKLERSAYFGGRTECFKVGMVKGPIYYVDINSMYPDVMQRNKFPIKIKSYRNRPCTIDQLKSFMKDNYVIAEVELNTDEPLYPKIHDKRTIFPIGNFKASLCHKSLEYALEQGHIEQVYQYAIYEQDYIFKDYIEFFYDLRLEYKAEGNKIMEQLCKDMLNHLYGKFGQQSKETKYEGEYHEQCTTQMPVYNKELEKIGDRIVVAGDAFLMFKKENEAFNSFVGIAAAVTDYARFYLWELDKTAKIKNLYYNDTDSLMINKKGYVNLKDYLDDKELGKLKTENIFEWVKIHTAKDYETPLYKKHKGVKKKAKIINANTFEQLQFPTLKGMFRSGEKDTVTIKTIRKTLSRKYFKGKVLSNGRVIPFNFVNDEIES